MYLFNKNNPPPRSRQGSLDAQIPEDSNWDFCPPPGSASSSNTELPSPPDRLLKDLTVRRSSVFTLRSRSNTGGSTASKDEPDRYARRGSKDVTSAPADQGSFSEAATAKQKAIFQRGKKQLRRQSSKLSSTAVFDDVEEVAGARRGSIFSRERKKSTYETPEQHALRRRHISTPFDFQHLTHTAPQQLPTDDHISHNELVAEFWAHRASQVPNRELRGIKAEDLQSASGSSEALNATQSKSGSTTPPHANPDVSGEDYEESPSPMSGVRHVRAIGSFSHPIPPNSPKSPTTVIPPPRTSSRLAMARGEDTPIAQALSAGRRSSGLWGADGEQYFQRVRGSSIDATVDIHAVTTPDDTAIPAISPTWAGTDLEHIAEEEESYFTRRSYDHGMTYSQSPEMSPTQKPEEHHESLPMRSLDPASVHEQLKSFANSRPHKPRPLSQMSETLGAPFELGKPPTPLESATLGPSMGHAFGSTPSSRRRSTFFKAFDNNSWEDDIDYCYEVAAEADCDFDWDRKSTEGGNGRRSPMVKNFPPVVEEQEEDLLSPTESGLEVEETYKGSFRPSLIVPGTGSVPDLDYRSAVSTSTNSLGALTPEENCSVAPGKKNASGYTAPTEADGFMYTPSLLVPRDFKEQVAKEQMYDDLLNDYEENDRHYPLLHSRSDNTLSIAESILSGPSRNSMGSSYDSSLRSASISLTSPNRRSLRCSTGSVPELVHSRRARRTMDLMVDQLSHQVSEIAHLDEDEDKQNGSSTSTAEPKTFFTDENETDAEDESRPTTSAGKASASTQHERCASEGAANILNAAQAALKSQHQRTASANPEAGRRPSKASYTLSLFPTPPKSKVSP